MNKEIGYIGLGKMGKNMVLRLLDHDWRVVAYNRNQEIVKEVERRGAIGASSIENLVSQLPFPRVIFIMVSHHAVDDILQELLPKLSKGDLVIDGGNSPYRETFRREKEAQALGIKFLDIGVSGGPGGARDGACMMVGGGKEDFNKLFEIGFFEDTCANGAYKYLGKSGAGHYVKMVHNGIEYGMMQSIAEGFDLLRHSSEFYLDLDSVVDIYQHKSVIESRLVGWMGSAYSKYGKDLNDISGRASASGEGKWTLEAGKREGISMPVIEASLDARTRSQENPSYQGKVVSALRGEFGKHPVFRSEDEPEIL